MSSEMTWSSWGWQIPRLTQRQLEQWSGATAQIAPAPPSLKSGHQQYLFGSVGQPPAVDLATHHAAPWLVGFACVALAAVALFSLVRPARHPLALVVLAGLLLALAVGWPALAVLLAQSATAVALMVVASRLIERFLSHRRLAHRPLGAVAAAQVVARRRRAAEAHEAVPHRPSTTATAALTLAAPEANP
jgi:hypothetical protein